MEITSIRNRKANMDVCPQYLHKRIDINKSEITVGKGLRIIYETGFFFGHEKVISVEYLDDGVIRVETENKTWVIQ